MILTGRYFTPIKYLLPVILLTAPGGLLCASTIQTLSIDLSPLHSGSILSGSVTLQNPLMLGDSAQIPLSFSDPLNYDPSSLIAILSVTSGTPNDQFRFSTITFTNLADNKTYNLVVRGAASCVVDFPCQATGGYEANNPPAFTGTYTITAASAAAVPEPNFVWLLLGLVPARVFGRRLFASRITA